MDIIDPIFNLHKIRFDVLDQWNTLQPSIERVCVYINLDNVFKLILVPRLNNFIQAATSVNVHDNFLRDISLSFISNIINLAQHYRLYCVKHGKSSRVILYWDYPTVGSYKNRKFLKTYRQHHQERYTINSSNNHILNCLDESYAFLKTCIQYVNEVYLIPANELECSLIPLIMKERIYDDDEIPSQHIIVSHSKYDYIYTLKDFTVLIPPMRKNPAFAITKDTVVSIFKERAGIKADLTAPSCYIPFIISLMGDTDRNIPKITGVGLSTILKMINVAIDQKKVTSSTTDIDMLTNIMASQHKEHFRNNYECTSLDRQLNRVTPLEVHQIKSNLVDRFDDVTLRGINDKYFKKCPIELILPKTEQILRDDYKPSIFK